MTLADGLTIFNGGVDVLKTPIVIWNNLSIYNIVVDGLFLSICGWFIARIIKGKSHNEHAVTSEFQWAANDGYFDASEAYADDWTGTQSTLEQAGGFTTAQNWGYTHRYEDNSHLEYDNID